jgi:glycosyltransferase involved in cell wall biosynthesis
VPTRRRIVLFDWVSGGHHPLYLRRFTEALEPSFEVFLAAPEKSVCELADLSVELISLGDARPTPPPMRSASWALRGVAATEVARMASIASSVRADHLVHLYADAILPRLVLSRRLPAPLTIVLFYSRAHYASVFHTQLSSRDRVLAGVKEGFVHAWRRRSDSNAVFSLDEEAVKRWAPRGGVPARWLPEPPVASLREHERPAPTSRSGCILYGALAERKGIDLLTRAVTLAPTTLHVTLAGWTSPEFRPQLERYAFAMRASGATVDLRARSHTELEGLRALAAAECAVLPYPCHDGMSRVLLEAATVGTPVIVHDRGLLGHLVRRHRLGIAVDCADPRALRDAILELTGSSSRPGEYVKALSRFSARFSRSRFERALLDAFAGAPSKVRRAHPKPSRRGLLRVRSASPGARSR